MPYKKSLIPYKKVLTEGCLFGKTMVSRPKKY